MPAQLSKSLRSFPPAEAFRLYQRIVPDESTNAILTADIPALGTMKTPVKDPTMMPAAVNAFLPPVLAPLEKSHRRRANNGGSGFHRYQCMSI